MKRILYLNAVPDTLVDYSSSQPNWLEITPNLRAARAIQKPHRSLKHLAQQICQQDNLLPAPSLIAYRTLQAAIAEVLQPQDLQGTTRTVVSAVKALLRAGLHLQSIQAYPSRSIQQIAELTERYRAQLHQEGLIDAADLFWQATQRCSERQTIGLYGYAHLQIDELTFLNAIAGDGSVICLPDADLEQAISNQQAISWLQHQGWETEIWEETHPSVGKQLQRAFLEKTPVPAAVNCYQYSDLTAEVRSVLGQVKQLLNQGVGANEIVLVARDDVFYGATVLDIAWEYQLPVRALYAVPLQSTRLGGWIQLLLEVLQTNCPFEATAKLLRHPLSNVLSDEVWTQARRKRPKGLLAWEQLGIDLSWLDWSRVATHDEWCNQLESVFAQLQVRQRCGRWVREIVAFYKFQDALSELRQVSNAPIPLAEFVQDVSDCLALFTVPAQPGRGGVELHTPLSVLGGQYKHIFVLGAVEGILPAPIQNDPVLDFYDRKALIQQGVPLEDAAAMTRRETQAFYALLGTATQSIQFSCPQLLGQSVGIPSPYLTKLGLIPSAPPERAISSLEEARILYLRQGELSDDLVLPNARHAFSVERRRESKADADLYDGIVGLPLAVESWVFSASQLSAIGQCPFKWMARYVLKLRELEEAETDLNPSLKGRLYHKTVEIALNQTKAIDTLREQLAEILEPAFLEAEEAVLLPNLPAWNARRQEHLAQLQRAISQPEFIKDQAEILGNEQEFSGQWYGLTVQGVVDRIDSVDDRLILLDYKTSSLPPVGAKNKEGKTKLDVQLPLYIQVAAKALFPEQEVAKAYYYSLTAGKVLQEAKIDETELQMLAERVKQHLEEGKYPIRPDTAETACQYCSMDLVCRKGNRLKRKGESQ